MKAVILRQLLLALGTTALCSADPDSNLKNSGSMSGAISKALDAAGRVVGDDGLKKAGTAVGLASSAIKLHQAYEEGGSGKLSLQISAEITKKQVNRVIKPFAKNHVTAQVSMQAQNLVGVVVDGAADLTYEAGTKPANRIMGEIIGAKNKQMDQSRDRPTEDEYIMQHRAYQAQMERDEREYEAQRAGAVDPSKVEPEMSSDESYDYIDRRLDEPIGGGTAGGDTPTDEPNTRQQMDVLVTKKDGSNEWVTQELPPIAPKGQDTLERFGRPEEDNEVLAQQPPKPEQDHKSGGNLTATGSTSHGGGGGGGNGDLKSSVEWGKAYNRDVLERMKRRNNIGSQDSGGDSSNNGVTTTGRGQPLKKVDPKSLELSKSVPAPELKPGDPKFLDLQREYTEGLIEISNRGKAVFGHPRMKALQSTKSVRSWTEKDEAEMMALLVEVATELGELELIELVKKSNERAKVLTQLSYKQK